MSKQRTKNLIIVVSLLTVFIILFLPKQTNPSSETRLVIDHTYETYIAPMCFQQAEATNYLEDLSLGEAQDLGYEPHDQCTEDALEGVQDRLIISLLKDMGILEKKWDEWQ